MPPQPYLSLEAELHDAFWEAEDDGSELRLIEDFLTAHPGPALEMGAGTGRLMFPLVTKGFPIEGLELSDDMLELARQRAALLGISPQLHHGDMSRWSDGRKFRSILAPAFTFQLAEDAAATLRHWADLLEPGGWLYLTVFIPYAELLGELPEWTWYEDHLATLPDGREGVLETRHRIDRRQRVLLREHRYSVNGERPLTHRSRQSLHWFEHRQMTALLARCGFRVERYFPDFDPTRRMKSPDPDACDGILTYHAEWLGKKAGTVERNRRGQS